MAKTVVVAEPVKIDEQTHRRLYNAQPYAGWRSRVRDYTPLIGSDDQDILDAIHNKVYGIVLSTGADIKTICAYFGWDYASARGEIGPTVEIAKAPAELAGCAR